MPTTRLDDRSDGTPMADDNLVSIFASLSDIADLVRVSAVCKRWRRLVSDNAAFICRTPRQPSNYIRGLALGFFRHDAAPRFVPLPAAPRLLGVSQTQTSLNKLKDDMDGGLFYGSRLVVSRNGLLVVALCRGKKNSETLSLCVCNPMTGKTDILPPLTGLKHYTCTIITVDDRDDKNNDLPQSPSIYSLLLVYTQTDLTVFQSYSSDEGTWSPETRVTGTMLVEKKMGQTRAGVVLDGGKKVYWISKNVVFGLEVDTSRVMVVNLPWSPFSPELTVDNTLLGVSPDGGLCIVHIDKMTMTHPRSVVFRVSIRSEPWTRGTWKTKELIEVEQFLPQVELCNVRPQWFCEKSGVVLFTVCYMTYTAQRSEVYALSLETKEVEKVASRDSVGDIDDIDFHPWENLHGYEMDRAAYLATLGKNQD